MEKMMFKIEWMYGFWENGTLYEGIESGWRTKEEIACYFKDHHLVMLKINNVLYERSGGGWINNLLGSMEEYLTDGAAPYIY